MTHPDDDTLRSWLANELPDLLADSVESHIESCDRCAQRIGELDSPDSDFIDRIRVIGESDKSLQQTLPGRTVGQTTPADVSEQVAQATNTYWAGATSINSAPNHTIKLDRGDVTSTADLVIKQRAMHSPEHESEQQESEYELLTVLGEGGMGVIYSARQSSMDRRVAVKMLKAARNQKADRGQFLEEAVITADLEHPNIVPIHELGSNQSGALFYAMKQVDGTSWRKVIDSKSLEENVEIWMRVADAIAFAHSRGIVHRDLKPDNVMIGQFGEVLVMDWGLAHVVPDHPTPKLKSTARTGGTPAYMAPEMVTRPSDIRCSSDIYLLGSILFEMLTGFPPHTGRNVMRCLMAAGSNRILNVPLKEVGGKRGIQYRALMKTARKALATKPDDRFATVTEFQDAVRDWLSHSESLVIAERSERLLRKAQTNDDYQDYVRAIFGFEQAYELYPANEAAAASLPKAKFAYASSAVAKEDYDLAASLLDENIVEHAELLDKIAGIRREHELRKSHLRTQRIALRMLAAVTVVLMVLGLLVTTWLRASALELANRNEPSMRESLLLQSGLRRSLSELRGWVALGESQFKSNRRAAWRHEILPPLARLKQLSRSEADQVQLARLRSTLHDLYEAQWWAEEVAQTPGNEPAKDLRLRILSPVEQSITNALASLVLLQEMDEGDTADRRQRLTTTRLQLAFALCHRRLAEFTDKGSLASWRNFQTQSVLVRDSMKSIRDQSDELSNQQRELVSWLQGELLVYFQLTEEVRKLRQSDQANIAQWRMRNRALPLARRAEQMLGEIVRNHRDATTANIAQVNRISQFAITIGGTLIVGVFMTIWMLMFRAKAKQSSMSAIVFFAVFLTQQHSSSADEEITPAHVHQRVLVVSREVELIRNEMGKPKNARAEMRVEGAAPRDVYFQAISMLRRTDQLCFELVRERVPLPASPNGPVIPATTMSIVDTVLGRIINLKKRLEIPEQISPPEFVPGKTPDDVFRAVVQINRQLDLLLDRRFSPSDTFQQLTLAVSYASRLLTAFPEMTRLPEPPEFERGKTPADVYERLVLCQDQIRRIEAGSGVKTVTIKSLQQDLLGVRPGEVYDLTSLIVAELAYLHELHGDLRAPHRVFQPGTKFPSHVYQRAGLLQQQLDNLEEAIAENPNWLNRKSAD